MPAPTTTPSVATDASLDARWLLGAAGAVLRRPGLWSIALVQLRRLAAPGWWRRRPFLPVPDAAYLRFRLQTMYGGEAPPRPEPADLVTYLHWCKAAKAR